MSTATNLTALRGNCPVPFFNPSAFPVDGGFLDGRVCAPVTADLTCCLPCPSSDYLYPPSFTTWFRVAEGINIASLSTSVFLVLSYLLLPADKTRRHYLSYCLLIGVMMLSLGFIIPFGAQPDQCYNEITPNDMYSSLTCAFSGAFIIAGGLAIIVWIFIRALSMHLQICWDVMPGKRFFYAAQALGWGVTAILFTITITFTGVSFRFGDACHVNSANAMADFWGPLLVLAGASALIQLATFLYCINVYLRNMWSDEKTETHSSAGLPSYSASTRTRSARAVYRRVRKVVWLQWRGILIVIFILVDVIFFSIVFVFMDSSAQRLTHDLDEALPWLFCLIENPTDRSKCYSYTQKNFVNQSTVTAVLLLLSLGGVQVFLLLARRSIFTSWIDYFRLKFSGKREFVSLDARRFSSDARTFELLKVGQQTNQADSFKSPDSVYMSPTTPDGSDMVDIIASYQRSHTPEYFGKETTRDYRSPKLSFSAPRAPSQVAYRMNWDPRSTHARGGLGLHPPTSEDDEFGGMSNKI